MGRRGEAHFGPEPNQKCNGFHRAVGMCNMSPENAENQERLHGKLVLILGFL